MSTVLGALRRRGCEVHVFAYADVAAEVAAMGAHFVDLFGTYPLEEVDKVTFPLGCRHLSYAAAYAEQLASDLLPLAPQLIVHDSFAVVGAVLGRLLEIPAINVRAGHNRNASVIEDVKRNAPRTHIGPACLAAVDTVSGWGFAAVTPYFYLSHISQDLNLYCEPPEFLTPHERAAFEPVAFFGSLAGAEPGGPPHPTAPWPPAASQPNTVRAYVSFGTRGAGYYAAEIEHTMAVCAEVFAERGMATLISHGDRSVARPSTQAERNSVSIVPWVDQGAALQKADLFVTHHGLNSTHEAILHGVPMLSYPLFGDQPSLARRCSELGLALPLVDTPRAPLRHERLVQALSRLADDAMGFRSRLLEARRWELDVIASRDAVLERMFALAAPRPPG